MEGNLRSKLYKAEIALIKALPFLLAVLYLIATILDYYMISSTIINYIALGILYVFIYISSYVFKFCEYHRMPIHYIVLINILSVYDVYIGIPLDTFRLMQMYAIVTCLFIFLTVYLYVKNHKKPTSEEIMVTQRKINIPIFDYKLTIVIFDKWEEVEHLFDGGPEPRAITKTRYGASLVAINSKKRGQYYP